MIQQEVEASADGVVVMGIGFAEGGSFPGSAVSIVVIHGFSGSPASFVPQVEAFLDKGWRVEVPLLPGHGTTPEDLATTRYADWWRVAEASVKSVLAEGLPTYVMGLSMGGTLTLQAAGTFPSLSGVLVVNPAIERPADSFMDLGRMMVEQGEEYLPGVGSDIAKPGVIEPSYDRTPIAAALSLFDAVEGVSALIKSTSVPAILFSSKNDHVVPPSASDFLVDNYGGSIERIWIDRSFHVATIDFDAELITQRAISWIEEQLGSAKVHA